ncbi:MAG: hypothetical protein V1933_02230 [Candidatus Omnitrophota bacterium]
MENSKVLGIILMLLVFLSISALVLYFKFFPKFNVLVKKVNLSFLTFLIAVATLWFVVATNSRAEKLFIGSNMPLIDVSPITVSQHLNGDNYYTTTTFSVSNYSGFKAYKIGIDLPVFFR